ncbi:MAG: SDR family NAD(P)-dependent oxidoreductase, partial [Gammaproteobacteria bacterium]|nr:SDR family NAD(P)-dependent oxidoreductase [Gammaproteobacteria bacterium]
MRLESHVAIVPGSTKGIGRAMAERFAAEGAKVLVTGR